MPRSAIEEEYLTWLITFLNIIEGCNYGMLLRKMYRIEFYSVVKYDEDRAADGLAIRHRWAEDTGYHGDVNWAPASCLETILGISMRIEDQLFGSKYMDDWPAERIFWDLCNNLGLLEFEGILTRLDYEKIVTIFDTFLSRDSKKRHVTNIFTFCDTKMTFLKLNLWDQMHLYIREKWPRKSLFDDVL